MKKIPTKPPDLLALASILFTQLLGNCISKYPKNEITPLLIITKLEQYDYQGATAIACVMLVAAFVLLLAINALQAWTRARQGR